MNEKFRSVKQETNPDERTVALQAKILYMHAKKKYINKRIFISQENEHNQTSFEYLLRTTGCNRFDLMKSYCREYIQTSPKERRRMEHIIDEKYRDIIIFIHPILFMELTFKKFAKQGYYDFDLTKEAETWYFQYLGDHNIKENLC